MFYIVAFIVITVTDAFVLNIFLKRTIADQKTTPPPELPECFLISAGANIVSTLARLAGSNIPFDLGVYGYLFWNKYGLSTAALIICLLIMWVINIVALILTFLVLGS